MEYFQKQVLSETTGAPGNPITILESASRALQNILLHQLPIAIFNVVNDDNLDFRVYAKLPAYLKNHWSYWKSNYSSGIS